MKDPVAGAARLKTYRLMTKRLLLVVAAGIAIISVATAIWLATPYPPDDRALEALSGSSRIEITDTGDRIVFRPLDGARAGLVFYPGGRVDVRAYAPLARRIAEEGYVVVLARMPLGLAVLDSDAAARIIADEHGVESWAVGGHSLGGAMAAQFALSNPRDVTGLILLAAYPASSTDLSGSDVLVLSMRGTEDAIVDAGKVDDSRRRLPADTRFVLVPGGNHAGFGSYGPQVGDGVAALAAPAQQAAAALEATRLLQETVR